MEFAQIIEQQTQVAREKLNQKAEQNKSVENTPFQGLFFVGNRQETVPFRLLTDKYLTPRAKTAWQMIKLNAHQFQGAVFPSYDELGHWLSDRAFQNKTLSRKTISQTLLLLRLTRWLTLCETVRNERGQVLGNVYVMNDEPLSVLDSLQLNNDYLRLLEKSTKHADPLIQDVAVAIIDELLTQKSLQHFVSHLDVIRERYHQRKNGLNIKQPMAILSENLVEAIGKTEQILLNSNKELSIENRELSPKMENLPSSNKELSQQNDAKSLILGLVPQGNLEKTQYSTSTNSIKYSTTMDKHWINQLDCLKLTHLEKISIIQQINGLNDEMIEAVLFEAHQRITQGNVKKPAGYLMSLIKKANSGDFNPYLINKSAQKAPEKSVSRSNRILDNPVIPPKNRTAYSTQILKQLSNTMKV